MRRLAVALALALAACQPSPPAPPDAEPAVSSVRSAVPAGKDVLPPAAFDEADVTGECKRTSFDSGTNPIPHLSDKPVFAGRQSFTCDGLSATIYTYDLGDAEAARKGAALLASKLWEGGPRPTSEHPDELLLRGPVIALVSGSKRPNAALGSALRKKGFAPAYEPAPPPSDLGQAEIDAMEKVINCAKPGREAYCKKLRAFAGGAPPEQGKIGPLIGVRFDVLDGTVFKEVAYLIVADGRGDSRQLGAFKEEEKRRAERTIAALEGGKALPADDPHAKWVAKQRLDGDAVEARRIGKSLVLIDEVPLYLREVNGEILVVQRSNARSFDLRVFRKP